MLLILTIIEFVFYFNARNYWYIDPKNTKRNRYIIKGNFKRNW